jgi:hypothetical protein
MKCRVVIPPKSPIVKYLGGGLQQDYKFALITNV